MTARSAPPCSRKTKRGSAHRSPPWKLRGTAENEARERAAAVEAEFERIAAYLADIDVDALWDLAHEKERRVLIDEMLDRIDVYADHLVVRVHGAPALNVTLEEVGLHKPRSEDWSCRRGDLNSGDACTALIGVVRSRE
jgi:hypothetical protein